MPQATEELREKWGGHEGVGEDKAIAHLETRGYVLMRGNAWCRPEKLEPSQEDLEAIDFLFQEWDYGGVEGTYK